MAMFEAFKPFDIIECLLDASYCDWQPPGDPVSPQHGKFDARVESPNVHLRNFN